MAKYSLGENNPVEDIFSDKVGEVSTFLSTGDRINQMTDSFARRQWSKILRFTFSANNSRSKKHSIQFRVYDKRVVVGNRKKS